jgi:regulatory protein
MKIERVLRKDDKNVVVYFENGEKLILSEDTFYQSGLRKGDEIPDDRFSFFIEQNLLYHIKQRALNYLGRRFHSERELFLKLKQKSYEERLIKIVLSNLKEKGFIDDKVFTDHFIDEKLKKKRWGRNKIKSALFSKGISQSIINESFSSLDEGETDFELAFELAQKKFNQLIKRKTDPKKYYQKISTFLISKGIEYDTCREVCQKILKEDFN